MKIDPTTRRPYDLPPGAATHSTGAYVFALLAVLLLWLAGFFVHWRFMAGIAAGVAIYHFCIA